MTTFLRAAFSRSRVAMNYAFPLIFLKRFVPEHTSGHSIKMIANYDVCNCISLVSERAFLAFVLCAQSILSNLFLDRLAGGKWRAPPSDLGKRKWVGTENKHCGLFEYA